MVSVLNLMLYFFSLQVVGGICGNALNLLVLLSNGMRTRTNSLLAATAVADMIFLLAMTPHYMSRSFPSLMQKQTNDCLAYKVITDNCATLFHRFYLDHKITLTFLVNWCSAASCWLIVTVSFERLLAIRMPLHARNSACSRRLCALLAVIFGLTAVLTFYHNVAFRVEKIPFKNEYIRWATIANIILVIACPLVVLIVVNSLLIYYLRRRHEFLLMGGARSASIQRTRDRATSESSCSSRSRTLGSGRERTAAAAAAAGTTALAGERRSNTSQWSRQMTNSQRKVTVMVALIVTCYVISHVPSAFLFVYMYFHSHSPITRRSYYFSLLSNGLLITGKVVNFFLFCTSSAHFRSRLRNILCGDTPKQRRRVLSQTRVISIPIVDRGNTPLPTPRSWQDEHLLMDSTI